MNNKNENKIPWCLQFCGSVQVSDQICAGKPRQGCSRISAGCGAGRFWMWGWGQRLQPAPSCVSCSTLLTSPCPIYLCIMLPVSVPPADRDIPRLLPGPCTFGPPQFLHSSLLHFPHVSLSSLTTCCGVECCG